MGTSLVLMSALIAVGICSVVAAFTLPVFVTAALRGNGRSALRAGALIIALTAAVFAIAATVGANAAIYTTTL
ncbi:hypothetical protein ACWKWN_20335 [Microbacterium trichothecenolyticum]